MEGDREENHLSINPNNKLSFGGFHLLFIISVVAAVYLYLSNALYNRCNMKVKENY